MPYTRCIWHAGRYVLDRRLLERVADPRLIVHEGSAEELPEILESHGLAAPDVVVSGIPFYTIPAAIGARIIESIRAALAPGGCVVAYQLRGVVADLATPLLGAPDVTLELLNIPPVRVLRWRVAGAAARDTCRHWCGCWRSRKTA